MWALVGLQRLIKNNFVFSENEITNKELRQYKLNSNNVLKFISEYCIISPDAYYSSSRLYIAYKQFCESEGLKHVSNPKFKNELLKIKGVEYNSSYRIYNCVNGKMEERLRAYLGITLLADYKKKFISSKV